MPKRTKKRSRRKKAAKAGKIWPYLLILAICAGIIWFITSWKTPESKPVEEPALTAGVFSFEPVVDRVAEKLGVPPGSITRKAGPNSTLVSIPIDRSRMDLTFANMIVKTEFEEQGADLASGKAEGNRQVITFQAGDQLVEVRLFYASVPAAKKDSGKYLVIVVDDFGSIGGELLQGFMELPVEVTFAIFSGMKNSIATMEQAHQQGRETLVHVPMEPINYPRVNPGDNPILVQMSKAEVDRTLARHLHGMDLCIGINNHMGSLATTDHDVMGHVMDFLKGRDLLFLDSRTTNVSIAYQTAQKAHLQAYRNDLFLDSPDISSATMERKIAQIKSLGGSRSGVIAITHCHSQEKLDYLKTFIRKIEAEGFTLLPLSRFGKYDVPLIM
ncbi:MAG: divergent polysaccharide deacetylase family protein [Candidatus Syntrophosphaera sp.]|nr:divergent polysaccharide deacetylase family protein [Candidatus Syntrophosphaera sp.]